MHHTPKRQTTPSAYSAYNILRVEALVQYMHAESGFPVMSTRIRAIKRGDFKIWPGLTYSNIANYFPHAVGIIKGHMVQSSQEVQPIKKKTPPPRGIKKVTFKATLEK